MTDLEKTKTSLLSQLVLLDLICNEFGANSKLHVATIRLEQWRIQADEILLRLGKRQTLDNILKMSAENVLTPADRFFEEQKEYRELVLRVIKDIEYELNQKIDESQSFLGLYGLKALKKKHPTWLKLAQRSSVGDEELQELLNGFSQQLDNVSHR